MVSNNLKKNKAEERARRISHNDLIVNRLMMAFILGVIAVFGMLIVKKNIANELNFITYVHPVLLVLSIAALVGAIVLFVLRKKKSVDDSERVFTKWNVLGAAIVFFAASVYYRIFFEASMVIAGVIAAVVLYFVFHTFPKDFFAYSVLTALGLLLLKMGTTVFFTSYDGIISAICCAAALVFAVVGIIFALLLHSGKGTLKLGGKKLRIYENKGGHIYPLIVSSVLMIAGGVLGFAASAYVAYAFGALLAAYIIIAVAYVIKMM